MSPALYKGLVRVPHPVTILLVVAQQDSPVIHEQALDYYKVSRSQRRVCMYVDVCFYFLHIVNYVVPLKIYLGENLSVGSLSQTKMFLQNYCMHVCFIHV